MDMYEKLYPPKKNQCRCPSNLWKRNCSKIGIEIRANGEKDEG